MPLLYGGNRVRTVPDEVADAFRPGDYLVVVQDTGDVLHIPGAVYGAVDGAVRRAGEAFSALAVLPDAQIDAFYEAFASALAQDAIWEQIGAPTPRTSRSPRPGRSTTRLEAGESMRAKMIEGLRLWRDLLSGGRRAGDGDPRGLAGGAGGQRGGCGRLRLRGAPQRLRRRHRRPAFGEHGGDAHRERRPGDGAGDRLPGPAPGPARAGLPEGAVALIDNPQRAAGWALFANPGLALAVARGSGAAVAQLGAVARQAGTPVSLHGTGGPGSWPTPRRTPGPWPGPSTTPWTPRSATPSTRCAWYRPAPRSWFRGARGPAPAGEQLGHGHRLHVTDSARPYVPPALFAQQVPVLRAGGETSEPLAQPAGEEALGTEWEWEGTPEVTLHVVPDVEAAVALFNRHSPRFVASPRLGGRGVPRALLPGRGRPLRGERLYALGGRAVRPAAPGAGALQLAVRAPLRPAGDPHRGRRLHGAPEGRAGRPGHPHLIGEGGGRHSVSPGGRVPARTAPRRCSRIRAVAPQMRSSPQGKKRMRRVCPGLRRTLGGRDSRAGGGATAPPGADPAPGGPPGARQAPRDLSLLEDEWGAVGEAPDHGDDGVVAGHRLHHRQLSDDPHLGRIDPHLLLGLAEGGAHRAIVPRLGAPAGEGHLAGVVQAGGAPDQEQGGPPGAVVEGDEDGRRAPGEGRSKGEGPGAGGGTGRGRARIGDEIDGQRRLTGELCRDYRGCAATIA